MRVAVDDIRLFFDVDGAKLVPEGAWMRERPTVILIHTGPGADHSSYKDHVGPALAESAQVVYLDVRGAGRSDRSTPEHWRLDRWADDLVEFCAALEIVRPVVLGTAFGAFCAVRATSRHPGFASGLVLVSAVARYSHTRSVTVFDRLGGPAAGEVAARYFADPSEATFAEFLRVCVPLYTRTPLSPDVVARMEMNIELGAHFDAFESRSFDLREEASAIEVPTLVLAGEDDPTTTISGARELVAAMPAGVVRFEAFADAGHGVFRDRPEAIELVREFVASVAGEPGE
jgi:proline iminopeptidase